MVVAIISYFRCPVIPAVQDNIISCIADKDCLLFLFKMMIRTTTKVIVEARIIPKMIPSTTPSVVSARIWFMYILRMGF